MFETRSRPDPARPGDRSHPRKASALPPSQEAITAVVTESLVILRDFENGITPGNVLNLAVRNIERRVNRGQLKMPSDEDLDAVLNFGHLLTTAIKRGWTPEIDPRATTRRSGHSPEELTGRLRLELIEDGICALRVSQRDVTPGGVTDSVTWCLKYLFGCGEIVAPTREFLDTITYRRLRDRIGEKPNQDDIAAWDPSDDDCGDNSIWPAFPSMA